MTVISKPFQGEDRKQYRWESQAGNSFTITEDDSEAIEGSGTRIILHLKVSRRGCFCLVVRVVVMICHLCICASKVACS